MERRGFVKLSIAGLLACAVPVLASCAKKESASKLSNQEKNWSVATSSEEVKEPIDLAYAKSTPAFSRTPLLAKKIPISSPKQAVGEAKNPIRRWRIKITRGMAAL